MGYEKFDTVSLSDVFHLDKVLFFVARYVLGGEVARTGPLSTDYAELEENMGEHPVYVQDR